MKNVWMVNGEILVVSKVKRYGGYSFERFVQGMSKKNLKIHTNTLENRFIQFL